MAGGGRKKRVRRQYNFGKGAAAKPPQSAEGVESAASEGVLSVESDGDVSEDEEGAEQEREAEEQHEAAAHRLRAFAEVVAEAVASEVEADAELVHNEDEEGGDDDELMAPSPAKGPKQLDEGGGRELHLDIDDDGSGGADDVSMGSVQREEGSERSIGLSDGEREMEGLQELLLQQSQERPASPEQETMELEAEAAAEETAAEEAAAGVRQNYVA
eukprot:jgi/Tetstr1/466352/TSEL_010882.t1